MFLRYRFNQAPNTQTGDQTEAKEQLGKNDDSEPPITEIDITPRSYKQKITLVHYFADDKATWFQYFRRPFYLFAFPNIVLAGIQFAFGCTAGIVSFNTISEIMTDAPYNWSAGSTGLIFLAALIGNFLG